ncbi:predicted protein [Sparassis crispa]|uniref:Uncharacterized protein n=1 Tax=Sparassis crispa TaxID=139825 RepID=A0A401G7U0_9APHY|nr:predicted protein [Sparassis crispa]GBE78236.1 predicted protein [Sparassis crispa]
MAEVEVHSGDPHEDVVASSEELESLPEANEEHEATDVDKLHTEETPVNNTATEEHVEEAMDHVPAAPVADDAAGARHEDNATPEPEAPVHEGVAGVTDTEAGAAAVHAKEPISPLKAKPTVKSSVSVKPLKHVAGPPNLLVKKIINSGTFGSGAVKHAPAAASKATAPSSATSNKPTATSTLRKSVSGSAHTVKAPMPPPPSRQSSTSSASTAARRQSIVPKAPTPTSAKSPLSSSTTGRPTSAAPSATRPSATTPDPSAGPRPRASVTEGVKRVPISRASLGLTSSNRPPSTSSARPTRTPGTSSVSSIKEIKDDSSIVGELQYKLVNVTASLESKTQAIAALEGEVATLKSSLTEALAEVQDKRSRVQSLEEAEGRAEQELADVQETLSKLQTERVEDNATLEAVRLELEATKATAENQTQLVTSLQSQIESLEAEIHAAKENLDVLRASSDEASVAAAAAADVEHSALLKAHEDLAAVQGETESLKAAHIQALAEAEEKIQASSEQASRADALAAELAELKSENEEKSTKVSELEIEILELKEVQESSEDGHNKVLDRLKTLEEELTTAAAAMQEAVDGAKAMEEEYSQRLEDAAKLLDEELSKANAEHSKLSEELKALEDKHAEAVAGIDQAKADAQVAAEEHLRKLEEVEKLHQDKQAELSEEIKRITADLESQEEKYNARVDAVKAEHDQLLQEAFERAKNDAGSVHSHDLQGLRAESQATIEQLRAAHQSTIEGLEADHEAAIETQVKTLENKMSNQGLELKATQDDLAKAKAAYTVASQELESLRVQLDAARQIAAAVDQTDKDELIARLTKDIANAREERAALNDVLVATTESFSEISNNHGKELEEAAKGRAEEITKLRAAHQEEVAVLVVEKSELHTRLSDLQGELATIKAKLSAEPLASPRSNGAAHARASSVTREELQRAHEAHNLKLHDLQAEHDRSIRLMREELEIALAKADELQQEVARKAMEIQYLEQDQEENQDQITRLKEDMDHLTDQLKEHAK